MQEEMFHNIFYKSNFLDFYEYYKLFGKQLKIRQNYLHEISLKCYYPEQMYWEKFLCWF